MAKIKEIEFQYGQKTIRVKIPENSVISFLQIKDIDETENGMEKFKQSLINPIESKSLASLAESREKAVIVIPDRTRPMPVQDLLPILLDEINAGGIDDQNIQAVIALGTHRAMTSEEIIKMVGKEVLQRISVINHAWDNPDALISIERTQNGTWIDVNKLVYGADLLVGLSSVKPHRGAGWSGGAKIIDPGVCGKRTIDGTHYMTVDFAINELLGVTNNPIRKEIEDVAGKVGLDFSINLVLNEKEEVLYASAGHFVYSHREAVSYAEKIYRDPQSEKADFMICGTGDWGPDFWSAVQAIFPAEYLVKEGGTVVIFAQCLEGFTPEHRQIEEIGYRPISEIKKLVSEGRLSDKAAAGHISAVSRIVVHKNIECIVVSEGIHRETAESVGLTWMEDPQSAVDLIYKKQGLSARGYLSRGRSVTDTVVIPW